MTMMMFNVKFVVSSSEEIYYCERFGKCFVSVKLSLFRAYYICFYDIGLWSKYSVTEFKLIEACSNKCIKSFFKNYHRLDSVTDKLSELRLPSFCTLFNNCVHKFNQRLLTSVNGAVRHFIRSFIVHLFISIRISGIWYSLL